MITAKEMTSLALPPGTRLSACLARFVAAERVPPFHFAIDKMVGSPHIRRVHASFAQAASCEVIRRRHTSSSYKTFSPSGVEVMKTTWERKTARDYAPICWTRSTMLTDTISKSPGFALSGTPTGPSPYSSGR